MSNTAVKFHPGSSWKPFPVDLGVAGCLVGAGAGMLLYPVLQYSTFIGVFLCIAGMGIAYVGCGTALWISSAHLAHHSTRLAGARTSLRHRRNVGRDLPCPYPDAWYAVALSAELPPGGILDAVVCGRSLVVFRRATDGLPVVLDAYCSHNGAHLAHGGARLVGDCIRCPFHGWCFDAQGRPVSTGVGDKPPPGSDLRSWPVLERNGIVSVWMAASGHMPSNRPKPRAGLDHKVSERPVPEPSLPILSSAPWWEPPVFPELNGGGYVYHGCSEHIVPALIYELPENGADIVHLQELHGADVVQGTELRSSDFVVKSLRPLLSFKWIVQWAPDSERPHIAQMKILESIVVFGRWTLPGSQVNVNVTQCISQVAINFEVSGIGRFFLIQTVTPVAPTTQRVLHAIYAQPHIPRLIAKAILATEMRLFEQDVPVWAHKRYAPTPRLTAKETTV